jgi:hypothetical protein
LRGIVVCKNGDILRNGKSAGGGSVPKAVFFE